MPGQPTTSYTTPASGAIGFLSSLTLALAAGWRVTAWGNGVNPTSPPSPAFQTGVSLSTSPFTSATTADTALSLANTSAWFVATSGDGSQSVLVQHGTTGAGEVSWVVLRSSGPFTGVVNGAVSATQPPTDLASCALCGTNANPYTFANFWNATPGRLVVSCDALADATYGWRMGTIVAGGGNVCTILTVDKFATSTTPLTNTDPVVTLGYFNATGFTTTTFFVNAASTAIGFCRYRNGLGGAGNTRITYSAIWYATLGAAITPAQTSVNQPGPEPWGGTEVALRIVIFAPGTTSNTSGYAGQTGSIRWSTVFGRANGQTLFDGTNYWIFMAGTWWLWDSSTPAI